jgi:hypothetical protein
MRVLKSSLLLLFLISVPSVLAQSPMMAPCASMHHHMNPLHSMG